MREAQDLKVGDHMRYMSTTWQVTARITEGYLGMVDLHLVSGNQSTSVLLDNDTIVEVR